MKPSRKDVKARFLKVLISYLGILATLQIIGIRYLIEEPSPHCVLLLAIFLGTILPILLSLPFMKLVRIG